MNGQQMPVEKKKMSLFGKPKPAPVQGPDMTEQMNSLNGRIRVLEERLNNLNRKFEVNESNDLADQKRNTIDFKTLNSEIVELKRSIEHIKEKLEVITREIPNLAARDELEVLKKYIEMWNPMGFVTRDELEKRLKEKKE